MPRRFHDECGDFINVVAMIAPPFPVFSRLSSSSSRSINEPLFTLLLLRPAQLPAMRIDLSCSGLVVR
jgi:hypothetical protein